MQDGKLLKVALLVLLVAVLFKTQFTFIGHFCSRSVERALDSAHARHVANSPALVFADDANSLPLSNMP